MSQIRLALADRDSLFLEKLSAYLHKNKAIRFSLELFTEPQAFEKWLEKGENVDLTVISSSFYLELNIKPENNTFLLMRDCAESLLPEGIKSIKKYMAAENLMKEMLFLCAEKIPKDLYCEKGKGNLNLVLYADGSDALNPFAQALAYYKASLGKKVFYLNLDDFSNTDAYFSANNIRGLSEVLYYIKSKKDNLPLKVEACTSVDINSGVSFMKGHNNVDDIKNLNQEELLTLIRILKNGSCSEENIISKGFTSDLLIMTLLRESHKVYITGHDYPTSLDRLTKIGVLLNDYDENFGIQLKDKVIFCINPLRSNQILQDHRIQGYSTVNLPYWDFDNSGLFPPSHQYISALKGII